MALTSTVIVATNCEVWLDDNSDSPTDLSGSSISAELTFENTIGEWRNFTSPWMRRKTVGKNGSLSLTAVYSTGSSEAFEILKNWYFNDADDARTVSLYTPDKNVGSDHYSGEYVLSSLSWTQDAEADDIVRVTAELMSHDEITLSTTGT